MKTMIGINTLTTIEQIVYSNHIQFFYNLGKNYPGDTFAINTPRRSSIDRMRNITAKVAIENDFDYVLFIDDDVVVPIDCFTKLKKHCEDGADIAAAWTIIRGHPFENMFFSFIDEEKKRLDKVKDGTFIKGETIQVDAVGFSCCLLKVSCIKRVPPPYFVTGTHNTEDIYFCMKNRFYFPNSTKIVVDTSIETAHVLGPEVIAPWNRESYTKYFEEIFPQLCSKSPEEGEKKEEPQESKELPRESVDDQISYEEVLHREIFANFNDQPGRQKEHLMQVMEKLSQ